MQSHQVDTQLEPKAIADLPDEVLIMIFKLLDLESLKQAVLTCKTWNLIIDDSISWPLNFPAEFEAVLGSSRKFKKVIVNQDEFFSEARLDIKELFFESQSYEMNYAAFSNVLMNLPNVEKITLAVGVYIQENRLTSVADFNKLTTLELNGSSKILACFEKAQLKRFKLFGSSANPSKIEKFFASQKSLTACELNMVDAFMWLDNPILPENVPFKLEELSLTCFKLDPYEYEHLLEFLRMQADSLVKLKLGYEFPPSIYELVFAKFKKLKKLCLITDNWHENAGFFERLEVNHSVTTLALIEHDSQCDSNDAASVIRKLPNIESLVLILGGAYETLTATVDNLKNLKHLTVQGFDLQFWQSFTFPKLESVKFVDAELEEGSDMAFVSRNLNLSSVVFDGTVNKYFLMAIYESFTQLVSWDLKKTKFYAEVETEQIRGLRLRDDNFFKHPKTSGEYFCDRDFQRIRHRDYDDFGYEYYDRSPDYFGW